MRIERETVWRRTALRAAGLSGALLLGAATAAAGQVGQCSAGTAPFGSLGIGQFQCVGGSCAINMRTGDPYAHSFSTEPRLRDIDRGGAGRNVLRDGDVLVAIDGTLITSAEGGRKLGSVRPGQDVRLTLRRNGREIDARLRARASCDLPRLTVTSGSGQFLLQTPDSARGRAFSLVVPDSAALHTWSVDSLSLAYGVAFSDSIWSGRIDSLPWTGAVYAFSDTTRRPLALSTLNFGPNTWQQTLRPDFPGVRLPGARPPVEFGLELACGECGWRGLGRRAEFHTSEFPIVESVERDGPADRAGILPGDVLFAVEGSPITSEAAARRLGALEPGETLTIEVRRGDRIVEVAITPREATGRRQRM